MKFTYKTAFRSAKITLLVAFSLMLISWYLTNFKELTNIKSLKIGQYVLKVNIADTAEKRAQGLSRRDSLKDDEGMFFVFEKEESQGFWMKDMNFAIDIVWLDATCKVVGQKISVAPSTYPEIFYGEADARYVLETEAGVSPRVGLKKGSRFDFCEEYTK